jgi:hypothetical protein
VVGWVNNAAVFDDAAVHDTPVAEILALITANLGLAVAGSAIAILCHRCRCARRRWPRGTRSGPGGA